MAAAATSTAQITRLTDAITTLQRALQSPEKQQQLEALEKLDTAIKKMERRFNARLQSITANKSVATEATTAAEPAGAGKSAASRPPQQQMRQQQAAVAAAVAAAAASPVRRRTSPPKALEDAGDVYEALGEQEEQSEDLYDAPTHENARSLPTAPLPQPYIYVGMSQSAPAAPQQAFVASRKPAPRPPLVNPYEREKLSPAFEEPDNVYEPPPSAAPESTSNEENIYELDSTPAHNAPADDIYDSVS
eukprot:m.8969 g.8969  ORF g.8969 m.8969 type:complete len:248 (+) comp5340_c0_seq1:57-800(+)